MTFQEAHWLTLGTAVVFRGRRTQVVGIDRWDPDMVYLHLDGVDEPVSYARVLVSPPDAELAAGSLPPWLVSPQVIEAIADLAITALAVAVYWLDRGISWLRTFLPTEQPRLRSRAPLLRASR